MNENIYNQILSEVCDYFGVRRYDVLMNKTKAKGKQNGARTIAVYLIRIFTQDKFYTIGSFFGNNASRAGGQFVRVSEKVYSNQRKYKKYKRDVLILERNISRKIIC